jgi:hypothetical protein
VGGYYVFGGWNLRGVTAVETIPYGSRFVGNDIQCPNGNGSDACASGNQDTETFYGNAIHNVSMSIPIASKLYHSLYWGTNANHIDTGWNSIYNAQNACRGILFHSTSGSNQFDLHVHDNIITNTGCDAIDFATIDPSKGAVEAYNNVIYNAAVNSGFGAVNTCIDMNNGEDGAGSGTVQIYNNTLYNCGAAGYSGSGAIGADESVDAIQLNLQNNIIYQANGLAYLETQTTGTHVVGSNNIWFGAGSAPSQTTSNISADPQFTSVSTSNFTLLSGSPAIDAGIKIATLLYDITGISRPQGLTDDLGAYERYQGTAPPSPCDLNGDGVVDSSDVQIAANQAVGAAACTTADLTGDGACTAVDVQRVVNAATGSACKVGP